MVNFIFVGHLSYEEISEAAEWCEECLGSSKDIFEIYNGIPVIRYARWNYYGNIFSIPNDKDAMFFKLAWGGK